MGKVEIRTLELIEEQEEETPVIELVIKNDNSTPVNFVEEALARIIGLSEVEIKYAIQTAESDGEAVVREYDDIADALSYKEQCEMLVKVFMATFRGEESEFKMVVRVKEEF